MEKVVLAEQGSRRIFRPNFVEQGRSCKPHSSSTSHEIHYTLWTWKDHYHIHSSLL